MENRKIIPIGENDVTCYPACDPPGGERPDNLVLFKTKDLVRNVCTDPGAPACGLAVRPSSIPIERCRNCANPKRAASIPTGVLWSELAHST